MEGERDVALDEAMEGASDDAREEIAEESVEQDARDARASLSHRLQRDVVDTVPRSVTSQQPLMVRDLLVVARMQYSYLALPQ